MERMSKLHVWSGLTDKQEDNFYEYFDLTSFQKSKEGEDFTICGFAKDINKEIYNEDFIGIYFDEDDNSLEHALNELPDPELVVKLHGICLENNFVAANAMFYYTDAQLEVKDSKKKYNSLNYLGCFDWDWD